MRLHALAGRHPLAGGLCAVLLTATACSSGAAAAHDALLPTTVPGRVTIKQATVAGEGSILVDSSGDALYMFPPDAGSRVSCTGACAGVWPPLTVTSADGITVGAGVHENLVGTLADPNTGERIVTYGGYPLYRYSGDVAPGQANGQALFNNGGPWYVLRAAGEPVTADPAGSR